MISRREFLQRRKSGIGGSDVAAVLGVSPWKTPYELYLDKTTDDVDLTTSARLEAGTRLEPVIADWYADRHPEQTIQRRNGMFRHREHPELVANIDRYIVGGGILECKTYTGFDRDRFGEGGDAIPEEYLLQVQHYMYVTGYRSAVVAVLIHGWDFREYAVAYDAELAEFAADKCVAFWRDHVLAHVPPPPTAKDDLAAYFSAKAGAAVAADARIAEMVAKAKGIKAGIKDCEAALDSLATEIKLFMGEAETLTGPDGKAIATWKRSKDREVVRIDWNAITQECAIPDDVIAKYTTTETKAGARPLLLK